MQHNDHIKLVNWISMLFFFVFFLIPQNMIEKELASRPPIA